MNAGMLVIIALVVAALFAWYVAIVKRKNQVDQALSDIDVQLAQRHDLVPNVLEIAKRFLAHEKELLEGIARLRSAAQGKLSGADPRAMAEKFGAENQLSAGLGRLFAVAENYPELKSDALMTRAQATYQEVETNVAAARRFYNASVTDLRNACRIFPGMLIAPLAGVIHMPPFFEAPAADKAPVNAADHL
ncbi:MAG: LemA family protein [Azonexus sp.]|jgi:LemA protein|uniref:LemA family protein n=1 Tax=Azonexus sp. TaxID=1872668 RepID=UPI002827FA1C|nr:LemA family protein [Azonexus sp.]MDR0777052.1 LemA family protein [Azonexus sp.]